MTNLKLNNNNNNKKAERESILILEMDSRQFGGISVEMFIHSTSFARIEWATKYEKRMNKKKKKKNETKRPAQ